MLRAALTGVFLRANRGVHLANLRDLRAHFPQCFNDIPDGGVARGGRDGQMKLTVGELRVIFVRAGDALNKVFELRERCVVDLSGSQRSGPPIRTAAALRSARTH